MHVSEISAQDWLGNADDSRQRRGVRKRNLERTRGHNSLPSVQTVPFIENGFRSSAISDPRTSTAQSDNGSSRTEQPASQNAGFVSHCSMIQQLNGHVEVGPSENANPVPLRDVTVRVTQASVLPRLALLSARTDAYMTHVFHQCPVVNLSDISEARSSVLLQQGLCMVGGLMTHESSGPEQAHELYQKLKLLLSINYEEDCVQTLKTLCLMSCWSLKPSTPVSLDGPWNWTGLAIQLVIQMGLHRESTYATRVGARSLRRIFWYLYVRGTCPSMLSSLSDPALLEQRLPTGSLLGSSSTIEAERF